MILGAANYLIAYHRRDNPAVQSGARVGGSTRAGGAPRAGTGRAAPFPGRRLPRHLERAVERQTGARPAAARHGAHRPRELPPADRRVARGRRRGLLRAHPGRSLGMALPAGLARGNARLAALRRGAGALARRSEIGPRRESRRGAATAGRRGRRGGPHAPDLDRQPDAGRLRVRRALRRRARSATPRTGLGDRRASAPPLVRVDSTGVLLRRVVRSTRGSSPG